MKNDSNSEVYVTRFNCDFLHVKAREESQSDEAVDVADSSEVDVSPTGHVTSVLIFLIFILYTHGVPTFCYTYFLCNGATINFA